MCFGSIYLLHEHYQRLNPNNTFQLSTTTTQAGLLIKTRYSNRKAYIYIHTWGSEHSCNYCFEESPEGFPSTNQQQCSPRPYCLPFEVLSQKKGQDGASLSRDFAWRGWDFHSYLLQLVSLFLYYTVECWILEIGVQLFQ